MYRLYFRPSSVLFLMLGLCTMCYALNVNGSGKGRSTYNSDVQRTVYNGLGYANGDYQMRQISGGKPAQSKSRQGIGLSAWGIIAVLGSSLFLGTVLYYAVLFYPILCKKERKYDIMELTSV